MLAIPALTLTDAMVTSSSASEPGVGESAFNLATAYDEGDKVILGSPSSTVTITIASPGVVTWSDNGLPDGTLVVLTTTGTLPTGLTAGAGYYVVNRSEDTFQLSAMLDGAPIVTTGSQSGVHTATAQLHRKYESLAGSNVGNPPAVSPDFWADIGPTNKWAMLDLLRNTGTSSGSPLTVVLTPGERINSVALVGLVADSISVSATSVGGGGSVYSASVDLSIREVLDWYDHFFTEFTFRPSVVLTDLPPYSDIVVTITITRASGNAVCGGAVLGNSVYIGEAINDAESDALNFSVIDRDDFGNAVLVPRRTIPAVNVNVRAESSNVNKIRALRTALNAVPAIWSGLDDQDSDYFEAVLILGIYRRFTINLDQPEQVLVSLELEEV